MNSPCTSPQHCLCTLCEMRANGHFIRQRREAEDHDAWFREQVRIGLDSASAGKLKSNEEVEAKVTARRAATRRKLQAL